MPICSKCNSEMIFRQGVSKKNGKPWAGHFCSNKQCNEVQWQRAQGQQPTNPTGGGGYVTYDHFNKTMNDLADRIAKLERNIFGEGGGSIKPDGTISQEEIQYAKEQNTASYEQEKQYNGAETAEQ